MTPGSSSLPSNTPSVNPDLAIQSITPGVSLAKVGDWVTFTIVAKNNGPDPSQLWVNTEKGSSGLAGPGDSQPGSRLTCGGVNEGTGPSNDGSWCEFDGVVPPGGTVTDTLVALVTGSGYATDMACAYSPGDDTPDPTNGCATATVTIDG